MRVITGKARGALLEAPNGKTTRPTSDMVKEAIFSIIQFEIEDAFVLDLFAGSGQLGIEALSRGAEFAVFVDNAKEAQAIIRDNIQKVDFVNQSKVVAMDYESYLATTKDVFDIVFLDPPYTNGILDKALPLIHKKMADTGIIICESDRIDVLPENAGDFKIYKEYKYGKKKLTVYRKENIEE